MDAKVVCCVVGLVVILGMQCVTGEFPTVDVDGEPNVSAESPDGYPGGLLLPNGFMAKRNRMYNLHPVMRFRWPMAMMQMRQAQSEPNAQAVVLAKRYGYALDEPPEPNEFLGKK